MILNQIGNLVVQEWLKSSEIRKEIELDQWVLMPNHIHGIVVINKDLNVNKVVSVDQGASLAPLRENVLRKPRSLSTFVSGFKSAVTRQIRKISTGDNTPVWQKNYYESIIRNEKQLNNIRQYIIDNPCKWDDDPENTIKSEVAIDFKF